MALETPAKRKRVLIVNHCGLFWPSGMVRAMQYKPLFDRSPTWEAVYTTRHCEFFARLSANRRLPFRLINRILRAPVSAYSTRWTERQEDKIVERAADFDVVSMIKSPGTRLYRRLCRLDRPRIVMDINDAVWLPEFRWDDLNALLGEVHGVICENEYVAAYARNYNPRVFVVSDPPQVEVFDRFRNKVRRDPQRIVMGWIGGAQNIGPLLAILEPLEALFSRFPQLHLRIVGAGKSTLSRFKHLRYSCRATFNQEEMVREVLSFDIGLFPLFYNQDGLARGTLKAKVYMAGRAVAVCEAYGENPHLVREGINGMLASSSEQWYNKLQWLISHPDERNEIARRGLQTIREQFTAARIFSQMLAAYDEVLRVDRVNETPPTSLTIPERLQ